MHISANQKMCNYHKNYEIYVAILCLFGIILLIINLFWCNNVFIYHVNIYLLVQFILHIMNHLHELDLVKTHQNIPSKSKNIFMENSKKIVKKNHKKHAMNVNTYKFYSMEWPWFCVSAMCCTHNVFNLEAIAPVDLYYNQYVLLFGLIIYDDQKNKTILIIIS